MHTHVPHCVHFVSLVRSPPVNPDEEIDDPEDRKPEDWDEREKWGRLTQTRTLPKSRPTHT